MNLCVECGYDMFPSNGEELCRLCRKNIVGFEPGKVIYADDEKKHLKRDERRRAA